MLCIMDRLTLCLSDACRYYYRGICLLSQIDEEAWRDLDLDCRLKNRHVKVNKDNTCHNRQAVDKEENRL